MRKQAAAYIKLEGNHLLSTAYIRRELLVKMVHGFVRGQVVLLITVDLKLKSDNLRLQR